MSDDVFKLNQALQRVEAERDDARGILNYIDDVLSGYLEQGYSRTEAILRLFEQRDELLAQRDESRATNEVQAAENARLVKNLEASRVIQDGHLIRLQTAREVIATERRAKEQAMAEASAMREALGVATTPLPEDRERVRAALNGTAGTKLLEELDTTHKELTHAERKLDETLTERDQLASDLDLARKEAKHFCDHSYQMATERDTARADLEAARELAASRAADLAQERAARETETNEHHDIQLDLLKKLNDMRDERDAATQRAERAEQEKHVELVAADLLTQQAEQRAAAAERRVAELEAHFDGCGECFDCAVESGVPVERLNSPPPIPADLSRDGSVWPEEEFVAAKTKEEGNE